MPALSESALPPFSLSITSRLGKRGEAYTALMGAVLSLSLIGWSDSQRSNSRLSTSSVASREPSLTTTTWCWG